MTSSDETPPRKGTTMTHEQVDTWIHDALKLVPKGDICQSTFRSALNATFRNALGPKPENPGGSVADAVKVAIRSIGCEPRFDPALLTLDWPAR